MENLDFYPSEAAMRYHNPPTPECCQRNLSMDLGLSSTQSDNETVSNSPNSPPEVSVDTTWESLDSYSHQLVELYQRRPGGSGLSSQHMVTSFWYLWAGVTPTSVQQQQGAFSPNLPPVCQRFLSGNLEIYFCLVVINCVTLFLPELYHKMLAKIGLNKNKPHNRIPKLSLF